MQDNAGLILTKRASLSPDMEGFVDVESERRFTFTEWNLRSNRTANALRELGVGKGDRVALLLMNSVEYMETFFAVAKIGAVCVPLNWRLTPEELSFIIRDAGAGTVVFGDEFQAQVLDLIARGGGENGTDVTRWVHVGPDEQRPDGCLSYRRPLPGLPAALPRRRPDPSDLQRARRLHQRRDALLRSRPRLAVGQRREDRHHAESPGDAQLHAPGLRPGALQARAAPLVHERRGAGAGQPDRGLREARHRGPPGLRPDRDVWPCLHDLARRRDPQSRLHRQGVLPHLGADRRRRRQRLCAGRGG